MSAHTTGYTDDHAQSGLDVAFPAIETWRNQFRAYEILIDDPEFTSVCPKTGLPDFGVLTIRYMPREKCLELKSLKEYLFVYRNLGIFQENIANQVLDDIVKATDPIWCEVKGDFRPRGGISTIVTARYPRMENDRRVEESKLPNTPLIKINAAAIHTAKELAKAESRDVTHDEGRQKAIVHHRFKLPCEKVYDAFLNPKLAGKFLFATPAGTMVMTEIDPTVGGDFVFVDRRDDVDVLHIGEYLELERPQRIVFRFMVPLYSPEANTVMLEFIAKGASVCDVMLTHTGLEPEAVDKACYGWKEILTAAEETLREKN